MAHTKILFRSDAREKVLRGATQLADAVRITLAPESKSVLIRKKWGTPIVRNDGVTIAKRIDVEDAEEGLGAQMLRQAAEKTCDAVGEGISTSTILAHAIFADGVRNVVAAASAIDLKRGLDHGLQAAVEALKDVIPLFGIGGQRAAADGGDDHRTTGEGTPRGGIAGMTGVASFYHLRDVDLRAGGRACRGLACFAARQDDPA